MKTLRSYMNKISKAKIFCRNISLIKVMNDKVTTLKLIESFVNTDFTYIPNLLQYLLCVFAEIRSFSKKGLTFLSK